MLLFEKVMVIKMIQYLKILNSAGFAYFLPFEEAGGAEHK